MDDLVGQHFGRDDRWKIVKKLGEGSIGAVFEAHDTGNGTRYAMKFLLPNRVQDGDYAHRFKREGLKWKGIAHPGLVRIFGLGRQRGLFFIVMEFVQGKDLGAIIDAEGPPEVDEALRICREVAEALKVVHENNVIHRDLKPDNVMLTNDGRQAKVLDFGMAKHLDGESLVTMPGLMLGTPGYMAPEYLNGEEIDSRSDIFSLGTIFYELLTGQRAFKARQVKEVLKANLNRDLIPAKRVNEDLERPVVRLLDRMLQQKPRKRFSSMEEVIEGIDEVKATLSGEAPDRSGFAARIRRALEA